MFHANFRDFLATPCERFWEKWPSELIHNSRVMQSCICAKGSKVGFFGGEWFSHLKNDQNPYIYI